MTTPDDPTATAQDSAAAYGVSRELVGLLLLLAGAIGLVIVLWVIDPRLLLGSLCAATIALGWRLTTPPVT